MLNDPYASPFEDVQEVGAVIKMLQPEQRHVGFLYKSLGGAARMLHLGWHHDLRDEDAKLDYSWVQCGLDPVNRLLLAGAVVQIAAQREVPINYSPIYQGEYFESGSLKYTRTAPGEGLTCATFIIAVMNSLSLKLFEAEAWPTRQDDGKWVQAIASHLAACGADQDHVEAIKASPSSARFRPEEVAGAFTESAVPVPFEKAESLGLAILDELKEKENPSSSLSADGSGIAQ